MLVFPPGQEAPTPLMELILVARIASSLAAQIGVGFAAFALSAACMLSGLHIHF
jgi:hypothetical protein